jgi:hypothetical protein
MTRGCQRPAWSRTGLENDLWIEGVDLLSSERASRRRIEVVLLGLPHIDARKFVSLSF